MANFYYKTEAGERERELARKVNYTIFIDIGSYRTAILCYPEAMNSADDPIKYIIPFGDEREFPSSYIKSGKNKVKLKYLSGNKYSHVPEDIVDSAKSDFIKDYSYYPDGKKENGEYASFVVYIKTIIEHTFNIITSSVSEVSLKDIKTKTEVPKYWNKNEIPIISGIRVTVPDLYIENLRKGYCNYILSACDLLCKTDEKWRILLQNYIKLGKNKNKKMSNFVSISADESGAGELYFLESVRQLPFIRFFEKDDADFEINKLYKLFSQRKPYTKKIDAMKMICCRIDIGGLTTDASVSTVEFMEENSLSSNIQYKLLKKESFSQEKAGEQLKYEYANFLGTHKNNIDTQLEWWNDNEFINSSQVGGFKKFLSRIINNQYNSVMKNNLDNIDAIYFVISGRPSTAILVQNLILNIILYKFNQEKLLILKENCLFMSEYPRIWSEINDERRLSYNKDFAKWVTTVGNLQILHGHRYSVESCTFKYTIKLESSVSRKNRPKITIDANNTTNLESFPEFKQRLMENTSSIELSFSNEENGEYTKFLQVSGSSCKGKYGKITKECYPILSIGQNNHHIYGENYQAWITPSINIENLETKGSNLFSLMWSIPKKKSS